MTPSPPTASPQALTLPCVDDEANILSPLRRLFRPHGYKVLVAGGGVEGLEMLAGEHVDLIISDMRMPGMDGATFLAEARQRYPDTVRLLLTGYADMDSTIAAISRRAPAFPVVGGDILEYRENKLRTVADAGIFDQAAADKVVSDGIVAWGLAEEPQLKKFVSA